MATIPLIVNDLSGLLLTPVDLTHYESLIVRLKRNGPSSFTTSDREFFYAEIATMIRKHMTN